MDELMNLTSKINKVNSLNNRTLSTVDQSVSKPNYDRSQLTRGILHIGLGNFHRAHLSWYLHRLMQKGDALDWAIVGAGVQEYDIQMKEKLQSQDFLTTLIELNPEGNPSYEIVGGMIDYIPIEVGNRPLVEAMADPQIRIVSLTVTEGGYFIDSSTGKINLDHPDLQFDINNPTTPKTVFGAIVSALDLRKKNGVGPFTGLSCDNLVQNGDKLKQAILGIASHRDLELAAWIENNCTFPNSMVDCIVPRTGEAELAIVQGLGIGDQVPVSHEDFRQWVIEDNFCAGRPNWEDVGAQFSDDVHGYEAQKIRILNGGHQVLANAAELLSIELVRDAMQNDLVTGLLEKVEHEEIIPHVSTVPGLTPQEYYQLIAKRFANPSILDTIRRVAFDGSSRHSGFITPSIRANIKKNGSIQGLALVEALWARMCLGTREDQSVIEDNDPIWAKLQEYAVAAKSNPTKWLELKEVYGDIADDTRFMNSFTAWLQMIYDVGVEKTIRVYLNKD